MQVRTRREGVDDCFGADESIADIARVCLVLSGAGRKAACVLSCDSIQYNIRLGSRSAFLLRGLTPRRGRSLVTGQTPEDAADARNDTKNTDGGVRRKGGVDTISCAEEEVLAARISADDELDRHDAFLDLSRALEEAFCWHGAFTAIDDTAGRGRLLMAPQVARELPARWVMQSLNETTGVRATRDTVTLLDRGETVRLRHVHDATLYTVVDVADMAGGQYWVEIAPTEPSTMDSRRVDREDIILEPPRPVYFDPLLPADEFNNIRGTSTCLFVAATLALRGICLPREKTMVTANKMKGFSKNVTVRMGHYVRGLRKKLSERCLARRSCCDEPGMTLSGLVEVRMTQDCVTLRYGGRAIEVLQRTVERLSLLWDARLQREREGTAVNGRGVESARDVWQYAVTQQRTSVSDGLHVFMTSEPFFLRAFTMLLRYRSLFGEMGYNQGPHAAVPPLVMRQLCEAFDVQCEAFASPINAQLSHFGSLFPDTDYYFGSLGSFFDLSFVAGHYEVNPPFVTAVLQRLQTCLLQGALACHDGEDDPSLLFVIVLPSHDLDDAEVALHDSPTPSQHRHTVREKVGNIDDNRDGGGGDGHGGVSRKRGRPDSAGETMSVERALRESSFCLAHALCAAAESAYVDGHQHLLRAPLFCIGTPTRLIVLGNRAARRRYDNAAERLAAVKDTWRRYTLEFKLEKRRA
ncbi:putative Phosphorylated CTD interacting factor 1 WW domain containing protein [Trypanosoma cruzi]|nr:putative Phosphorylated CTD interacting factor 1 WW domain containing protein [Trypanosoma cruzi]